MNKKGFIILESLLYIVFMVADYFNYFETSNLKYAGIVLCFLYCLFSKSRFGIIGLALTLEADYWLLLKDDKYPVGIIFFILVQIVYLIYLKKNDVNPVIIVRIIIPAILLFIVKPKDVTNILALIYFPQILLNAIMSFKDKKHRLFSLALCLFVLCDVCVGLHNIFPTNLYIALGQWFFYLPSQVLIALSLY